MLTPLLPDMKQEKEYLRQALHEQVVRMNQNPSMSHEDKESILAEFGYKKLSKADLNEVEKTLRDSKP